MRNRGDETSAQASLLIHKGPSIPFLVSEHLYPHPGPCISPLSRGLGTKLGTRGIFRQVDGEVEGHFPWPVPSSCDHWISVPQAVPGILPELASVNPDFLRSLLTTPLHHHPRRPESVFRCTHPTHQAEVLWPCWPHFCTLTSGVQSPLNSLLRELSSMLVCTGISGSPRVVPAFGRGFRRVSS